MAGAQLLLLGQKISGTNILSKSQTRRGNPDNNLWIVGGSTEGCQSCGGWKKGIKGNMQIKHVTDIRDK